MLSGSAKLIGGLNQLQHQKNYIHHLKRMIQIETQQQRMRKVQHEQTKIADILRKSKEASKSFKKIEDLNRRKDQDRKMVEVLIDIKSRSRLNTEWGRSQSHQNLKNIKSKLKALHSQAIVNQKKVLLMQIGQNSVSVRKHRKKPKMQVDSLLKKKNPMPKINKSQNQLHGKQHKKHQRPLGAKSTQHQNGIHSSRVVITLPD